VNLRDKFLARGIPYDKLDEEMIEIVNVFNFELGLKTAFCCYGHRSSESSYIIFDQEVTDEQILKLANIVCSDWKNGFSFYKWVRHYPLKGDKWELRQTWKFQCTMSWADPNSSGKLAFLNEMVETLKMAKEEFLKS